MGVRVEATLNFGASPYFPGRFMLKFSSGDCPNIERVDGDAYLTKLYFFTALAELDFDNLIRLTTSLISAILGVSG